MNTTKWKLFEVSEIFTILTGALLKPSYLKSGLIPRITATSFNNGISTFTNEISDKNFRKYNNFISVSFLGDVFYQPNEVSLDMKIHGIKLKDRKMTKDIALYLIPLIKKFSKKYSYGNQLSSSVLARQKLLLPIKPNGSPDWEYMEYSVREAKRNRNEELVKHLRIELDKVREFKEVNLINKEWTTFKVKDIFKITRVTGEKINDYSDGPVPYVTTSSVNNGVTDFIETTNNISNAKTLSINPIGSSVFYHDYVYVGRGGAGSSINTLELIENRVMNEYIGLFIATALSKNTEIKASYGVQLNGDRLKNMKFLLPINSHNNPDYDLMENYIKKLKFNRITKALNFLENN